MLDLRPPVIFYRYLIVAKKEKRYNIYFFIDYIFLKIIL